MKFDVIIIGGGLAGVTAATALQREGRRCAIVSAGLSPHKVDLREFRKDGGTVLAGDAVTGGIIQVGRLLCVYTGKLGDTPLEADHFILATGKYFSRGLSSDMDRIYETIFGLDVEYAADPADWFAPGFHNSQPFMQFGVKSKGGCALKDGVRIANLYPVGEILAGIDGSDEDADARITGSALEAVRIIKGE